MSKTPKALLAAISAYWEAQTTPQAAAHSGSTAIKVIRAPLDPDDPACAIDAAEPPFESQPISTICAKGGELSGYRCKDLDRAARHLVHLVRTYPFRPYRIEGGGCGVYISAPRQWQEDNAELVASFLRVWWTAAGDAVLDRYSDRLPLVEADRPPEIWGFNPPRRRRRKPRGDGS